MSAVGRHAANELTVFRDGDDADIHVAYVDRVVGRHGDAAARGKRPRLDEAAVLDREPELARSVEGGV